MLLLALTLLILNSRSALHTTFAAFFAFRGGLNLWPLFDRVPGVSDPGENLMPLLLIASLFTVPLILNNFRRCHCIAHSHAHELHARYLNAFFAVTPVCFALIYLWDSSLYAPVIDLSVLVNPTSPVGPLYSLTGLDVLAFAWLGLSFAHEVRSAQTPLHRSSYMAVALAFSLLPLYEGVSHVVLAGLGLQPLAGVGWARALSGLWLVLAALVSLLVIVELVRHALRLHQDVLKVEVRGQKLHVEIRGFLLVLFSAVLCALLLVPMHRIRPGSVVGIDGFFSAFWAMTLPIIVTYAILRHRLFDLDLRIRQGVKGGTITAAFIAAFFAVSEGAQEFFSSKWGPVLGIGASAMLVFALAPLQRVADRLANAAVPTVKEVAEWTPGERRTFYREQVHIVWGDGSMSRKERTLLDHMRQRLGLTAEEAAELEDLALKEVQVAQATPSAGASSGTTP